ncbi:glycosyltransferase [Celeribacter persicus]|uniref:Glycosyltransferase involved in cell wall biosynthesis n=1 Tax=Celeribacter persicus TaxID=1651082 RepID=A0A2T5H0L1_9RHOB|nr:glycosyltransferase [Celeribacter persicus]PTQ65070.1 glycosyltransferase involved in cell wall biosynthesis [Celeribacter persicus]
MKIAMFTNTFTPHIGGVAQSVSGLSTRLRDAGHEVLIVAPEFEGGEEHDAFTVRMSAFQNFAGSDFSVPVPIGLELSERLETFRPDIVHSHHPFLLGDTALRVATRYDCPVVFTYHTRYELYSHYVAQNAPSLRRLVVSLATGYCNLCDAVIAPSESIASFLAEHEVTVPVKVIPTGIDAAQYRGGRGDTLRARLGIPQDCFVAGHVGRLAEEKNLVYLAEALISFLIAHPAAHALIVGDGDMREDMQRRFEAAGLSARAHLPGAMKGRALADAYAAMDVFAFSSVSETQGLVLAEAMTAGLPVVALEASGVREILRDGQNGRLLARETDSTGFATALAGLATTPPETRARLAATARETAAEFSWPTTLARIETLYEGLRRHPRNSGESLWQSARRRLEKERDILGNLAHALGATIEDDPTKPAEG